MLQITTLSGGSAFWIQKSGSAYGSHHLLQKRVGSTNRKKIHVLDKGLGRAASCMVLSYLCSCSRQNPRIGCVSASFLGVQMASQGCCDFAKPTAPLFQRNRAKELLHQKILSMSMHAAAPHMKYFPHYNRDPSGRIQKMEPPILDSNTPMV